MHSSLDRCDPAYMLKSAGLKTTTKRLAVLGELIGRSAPVSVAELHRTASSRQGMDLATAYRVLNAMVDAGVVREAVVAGGERLFEVACRHHNPMHAHFTCDACGRVYCLDPFPMDDAVALAGAAEKFRPRELNISMQGTCADCIASEDS